MNHLKSCILLVDDDPATNYLNKYFLEKVACAKHIFQVTNGKEALDFILQKGTAPREEGVCHLPDLIILDIHMDSMNGFDFLEAYGALHPSLNQAKVIILSTSDYREDMDRAAEFPCVVDYLVKPIVLKDWQALALKHGKGTG